MIATYLGLALLVACSLLIGQAILAASGWRDASWVAGPVGLAACCVVAWLAVRLPGDNVTALVVLLAAATGSGLWLRGRVAHLADGIMSGLPAAMATVGLVSIPFLVEGHFGILGTGFNVDMSQHLFAADRLVDPTGVASNLDKQGYPLGPHALAAAATALPGGTLVGAFSGVTLAAPVLTAGAIASLFAAEGFGPVRRLAGATIAALPYLVASYLAQGAFKEIFLAGFVVAAAILVETWRREGFDVDKRFAALPMAVIAAGLLYSYSAPGLAWIIAGLATWAVLEGVGSSPAELRGKLRRYATPVAVAIVVTGLIALPEASRIVDFQGQVSSVASSTLSEAGELYAAAGESDETPRARYDNSLGNLFGDISPLEAFGIWPTGDFRVQADAGSVPAGAFYFGALVGLLGFAVASYQAMRRGAKGLLGMVWAAAAIAAMAYLLSTPYTAAKALEVFSALAMLLSLRELLAADFSPLRGSIRQLAGTGLAAAVFIGATGSTALALANAPVGPEVYTTSLAKLRGDVAGQPTLVLAPQRFLEQRHGREYLAWELRSSLPCIEAFEGAESLADPDLGQITRIITTGGGPDHLDLLDGLAPFRSRGGVEVYDRLPIPGKGAQIVPPDPGDPTRCGL